MKKIFKYKLNIDDFQPMELPKDSEILSVKEQYGDIVLYAMVDPELKVYERYDIVIKGTGYDLPDDLDDYRFLGTVKLMDGKLMFHVFYKKTKSLGVLV